MQRSIWLWAVVLVLVLLLIVSSMLGFNSIEVGDAFAQGQDAGCERDCATLDDKNLAEVSMSGKSTTGATSLVLKPGLEQGGKAFITDSSVLNFGFTPVIIHDQAPRFIGTFTTINNSGQ